MLRQRLAVVTLDLTGDLAFVAECVEGRHAQREPSHGIDAEDGDDLVVVTQMIEAPLQRPPSFAGAIGAQYDSHVVPPPIGGLWSLDESLWSDYIVTRYD